MEKHGVKEEKREEEGEGIHILKKEVMGVFLVNKFHIKCPFT